MVKKYTLGKNERLKSRKQIEQLFNNGQRFVSPPFRIFYSLHTGVESNAVTPATAKHSLQAGFGASSRNFKTAVERTRIKRLTREAYRLQKKPLQDKMKEQNRKLNVFFIYTGKELPGYTEVYNSIHTALARLLDINKKV